MPSMPAENIVKKEIKRNRGRRGAVLQIDMASISSI